MLKHFISLSLIVLFVALALPSTAVASTLDETRIVPVKIFYTDSWLKWHGSRAITRAQKIVEGVSRVYEKEFGIKLLVATAESVKIDSGIDSGKDQKNQLASDMETVAQQVAPPQDGIVICFTAKSYISRRAPHQWGKGRVDKISGKFMLISDEKEDTMGGLHIGASRNKLVTIAVHELAHLLGCSHSEDKNSIMYEADVRPTTRWIFVFSRSNSGFDFDPQNRETILRNKWRAFQSDTR